MSGFIANDDFPDLREVLNTRTCPIYRQKILSTMPVYGLWWMDADQWTRFLWQGHNGHIVKSGQDPDRVLTTRRFEPGGSAYVRIMEDRVDIEGLSRTTKWNPEGRKLKKKRTVREWLTVSITFEEYENLVDNYLGPVQDVCCKHQS